MSPNQIVFSAVERFGYPVELDLYDGPETIYFTFSEIGEEALIFGDNEPQDTIYDMAVYLHCPINFNYFDLKDRVKWAVYDAGNCWPTVDITVDEENRKREIAFYFKVSIEETRKE